MGELFTKTKTIFSYYIKLIYTNYLLYFNALSNWFKNKNIFLILLKNKIENSFLWFALFCLNWILKASLQIGFDGNDARMLTHFQMAELHQIDLLQSLHWIKWLLTLQTLYFFAQKETKIIFICYQSSNWLKKFLLVFLQKK